MKNRRILVFAPHPDDEFLGCGGTMARYIAEGGDVSVCYVTSGQPPIYDNSAAVKNGWPHTLYPEIMESKKTLGIRDIFFLEFPAVDVESIPRYRFNQKIQELINSLKPDTVFMPHFGDMQKDHTFVTESIMVAVRPKGDHSVKIVYAYETLSETEWNIPHVKNVFLPNVFVDITNYLAIKKKAMSCYQSQLGEFPNPRSLEAVEALAKLRGSTMGVKAAEAFYLVREYRTGDL